MRKFIAEFAWKRADITETRRPGVSISANAIYRLLKQFSPFLLPKKKKTNCTSINLSCNNIFKDQVIILTFLEQKIIFYLHVLFMFWKYFFRLICRFWNTLLCSYPYFGSHHRRYIKRCNVKVVEVELGGKYRSDIRRAVTPETAICLADLSGPLSPRAYYDPTFLRAKVSTKINSGMKSSK